MIHLEEFEERMPIPEMLWSRISALKPKELC
jgi:hypothetical protein